jgi:hypothetical protein
VESAALFSSPPPSICVCEFKCQVREIRNRDDRRDRQQNFPAAVGEMTYARDHRRLSTNANPQLEDRLIAAVLHRNTNGVVTERAAPTLNPGKHSTSLSSSSLSSVTPPQDESKHQSTDDSDAR